MHPLDFLQPQVYVLIMFYPGLRGVSRPSRALGWNAVDAAVSLDGRHDRGRRSRVVLAPLGWRQVGDDASHRADDGD